MGEKMSRSAATRMGIQRARKVDARIKATERQRLWNEAFAEGFAAGFADAVRWHHAQQENVSRVLNDEAVRMRFALSAPPGGSACRCGSGAHPRRCAVHPERYAEHCRELSEESGGSDKEEEGRG